MWGYENTDIIEKVHTKFCKFIFGVSTFSHNRVYANIWRARTLPAINHYKTENGLLLEGNYWGDVRQEHTNKVERQSVEVYMTAIKPAMVYGEECWAVRKKKEERKLHTTEMRMLRWVRP